MTVFSISRESERDSYQKSLWLGSVPWTCHDGGTTLQPFCTIKLKRDSYYPTFFFTTFYAFSPASEMGVLKSVNQTNIFARVRVIFVRTLPSEVGYMPIMSRSVDSLRKQPRIWVGSEEGSLFCRL